jgi:putative oxygen-independent coproporphyrinogen III oxidase
MKRHTMDKSLSLYVHIPFCRSKCAYCDFNSYAGQEALIPAYVESLLREADAWSGLCVEATVETLFFGGGTPSLVPPAEMKRLMEGLRQRFAITAEAEVSLEANPESVNFDYLRGLRDLGINRLSLGVQSFDDEELRFLGRIHGAADAEAAYGAARQAGFKNVGLDLIFGLPQQQIENWQRSLEKAIRLEPEHLSLYALTVEENTPLGRAVAANRAWEPDEDAQAEMYEGSEERLEAVGYDHYETSNWAWPGHRCRHNLTYWETRPYLGLGAGAHSYLRSCRFANTPLPQDYIEIVQASGPAEEGADGLDLSKMPQVTSLEHQNQPTEMSDMMILGLRLTEGVSRERFRERFGVGLEERYPQEISDLTRLGLLEIDSKSVRVTRQARLLANEALLRFLPESTEQEGPAT